MYSQFSRWEAPKSALKIEHQIVGRFYQSFRRADLSTETLRGLALKDETKRMILDVELLQLYRSKQLIDLLNRGSTIFEYEGFPYLSLEWSPAASNTNMMLAHASLVWDNYSNRLGEHGMELSQFLSTAFSTALMRNKKNTIECQNWKLSQGASFAVRASAPKTFLLTEIQRHAICQFRERPWYDMIAHAVCRERDCALFLVAKTSDTITPEMFDRAGRIMAGFASAYRYLHSHSVVVPDRNHGPERMDLLSRREVECLQWLALGKTLSEAAMILGITERTLRFHVSNARERLGVATTMQAVVAAAMVYGIDPNDPRHSIYAASRDSDGLQKKRAV